MNRRKPRECRPRWSGLIGTCSSRLEQQLVSISSRGFRPIPQQRVGHRGSTRQATCWLPIFSASLFSFQPDRFDVYVNSKFMQQPSKNGSVFPAKQDCRLASSLGKITRRNLLFSFYLPFPSSCRKFRSDPEKITAAPNFPRRSGPHPHFGRV